MAQQIRTHGRFAQSLRQLARDTRGNTYFMVAAAMLPIIGMVGSGVDIGRAYMADLRLQQACDAGVLAGRRAMVGATYSSANQSQATKMFNFNYQASTYGSTNITFSSVQDGPSNVRGTATAKMPTALMQAFGQTEFNLSVNCTAKLEISNVDTMLVLDVTGSMSTVNPGDSVDRITGMKNATMSFFDTLTSAANGDGRLRFGVVPYNHNVNVGAIIAAKNINYLAEDVTLPSRTPRFDNWSTGTTTYGTIYDGVTTWGGWANNGGTINGKNSTTCPQTTLASSTPTTTGSPWQVQTGQTIDANGNRITTHDNYQNYNFYGYQYVWSNSQCRRQRRTGTFTRTTPSTLTQTPAFSGYVYEDRPLDVGPVRNGGTVTYDVGDNGTNSTVGWGGCIIDAGTEAFAANAAVPATAYDMDIDLIPTLSNPDTLWWPQVGGLVFPRNSNPSETTTTDRNSFGSNTCPVAAMKLTTHTAADRGTFNTYIQSLAANGTTYHAAGMAWGSRLLSPNGFLGDENTSAPNTRPIQRHLIFMTDGEMVTRMNDLSFQGYEYAMARTGATSDNDSNSRHTWRFRKLCDSLKAKNVTVWTIGFGTALTSDLIYCASGSDKAFQASSATQLNTQFQAIARQIARLRIHE